MVFGINAEQIVTVASLIGAVVSAVIFLWRIFRIARTFINNQEVIQTSLDYIKSEVTYNGGGSTKDMILKLTRTCDRMEASQKIIDQRSKASLNYQNRSLFETDKKGHLVWANEKFYQQTVEQGDISGGLDWVSVIDENEREDFVTELSSCLKMGRRIDIETSSVSGLKLRFIGHPYRVGKGNQEGFLIQIQTLEN